jgi:hypothetical protein
MATRFYLPSSGTPGATPSAPGPNFPALASSFAHLPMPTAKGGTARAGFFGSQNSSGTKLEYGQFVSAPLDGAQTVSGSIGIVVMGTENNTSANLRLTFSARVVSGDGATVRGLLTNGTNSAELNHTSTGPGARYITIALASVAAQDGDRLAVSVGVTGGAMGGQGYLYFGDDQASDLPASSTNVVGDPWVEFSANLALRAEGGGPAGSVVRTQAGVVNLHFKPPA